MNVESMRTDKDEKVANDQLSTENSFVVNAVIEELLRSEPVHPLL